MTFKMYQWLEYIIPGRTITIECPKMPLTLAADGLPWLKKIYYPGNFVNNRRVIFFVEDAV